MQYSSQYTANTSPVKSKGLQKHFCCVRIGGTRVKVVGSWALTMLWVKLAINARKNDVLV